MVCSSPEYLIVAPSVHKYVPDGRHLTLALNLQLAWRSVWPKRMPGPVRDPGITYVSNWWIALASFLPRRPLEARERCCCCLRAIAAAGPSGNSTYTGYTSLSRHVFRLYTPRLRIKGRSDRLSRCEGAVFALGPSPAAPRIDSRDHLTSGFPRHDVKCRDRTFVHNPPPPYRDFESGGR